MVEPPSACSAAEDILQLAGEQGTTKPGAKGKGKPKEKAKPKAAGKAKAKSKPAGKSKAKAKGKPKKTRAVLKAGRSSLGLEDAEEEPQEEDEEVDPAPQIRKRPASKKPAGQPSVPRVRREPVEAVVENLVEPTAKQSKPEEPVEPDVPLSPPARRPARRSDTIHLDSQFSEVCLGLFTM